MQGVNESSRRLSYQEYDGALVSPNEYRRRLSCQALGAYPGQIVLLSPSALEPSAAAAIDRRHRERMRESLVAGRFINGLRNEIDKWLSTVKLCA